MQRIAISSLYPLLPSAAGIQVEDPVDTDEVLGLITAGNHLQYWRARHATHRTIQYDAGTQIRWQDPGLVGVVQHYPIWWRAADYDRHVVLVLWYQARSGASGGSHITATLRTMDGDPLDDPAGLGPGIRWHFVDGSLQHRQDNDRFNPDGTFAATWPVLLSSTGDTPDDDPAVWPSRPRPLQIGPDGAGQLLRLDIEARGARLLAVDVYALYQELITT